ncbi:hypothetical protein ABHN11_13195 [Brevibacillus centrosporus]|uniref:hypothetical protein n=1 Tax=Brevibacillus centrosporus TaxID=54910 RepID=UPI003988A12B
MKHIIWFLCSFGIVTFSCIFQTLYHNDAFLVPILIVILISVIQVFRQPYLYHLQLAPVLGSLLGIAGGAYTATLFI